MAILQTRNLCNFYGELYQYKQGTIITINTINVFEIITGMSSDFNRGFTFQNSQELKCSKAGKYNVQWSTSFQDGNNKDFEISIFINSTNQIKTSGVRKLGSNDTGNMGGGAILDLEIDDLITLRIANTSGTSNPTIITSDLTLTRLDN